jgi:hypothetical protein
MAFSLKMTQGITVVPIILSECAWQDVEDVSAILALPEDRKSIDSFPDKNIAWKNVYDGLKKVIEKRNTEMKATNKSSFNEFLEDTEMLKSAHAKKNIVLLQDIFVFPELQKINFDDESEDTITTDTEFLSDLFKFKKLLIAGESQSGKTTLCKIVYTELRKRNLFPVYIFDKTYKYDGLIKNRISIAFQEQYENIDMLQLDKDKIIIIIDGFHLTRAEKKQKIIRDIEQYKYQILIVDDIFALNVNDENITKCFYRYKIDQFSPTLRDKLIKKWIYLTDDKSYVESNDNEFYKRLDTANELIDITLGKTISKGIMPSYPVFILSILSSYETFEKPLDQEISSQGYCYQALIYICLRKQGVKNDEIDIYINFLSVLAYHYFSQNVSELSESDFNSFIDNYNKHYYLPIKIQILISNLLAHRMLSKTSLGNYKFFYPYLYYYFVAKFLADHVSEKEQEIFSVIENLHKDENAYIAIFISHHIRNYNILDEIILNAMMLFEKFTPATLNKKEMQFFDDEINIIAKAALPKQTSPELERTKRLEQKTEFEKTTLVNDSNTENTLSKDDILSQDLRRSIRTVEVMGIIAKNRMGSLEKTKLEEILTEAINVNLRILTSFFDVLKDKKEQSEMIDYISDKLEIINEEKKVPIPAEKLEKEAKKLFWNLSFSVIFGIISKTIRSIGSDKFQSIIEEICNKQYSSAHFLIKHGIFMWYGKNINIDKILKDTNNPDFSETAKTALRYLIINHCKLHSISAPDKQRLKEKLNISQEALIKLEAKK